MSKIRIIGGQWRSRLVNVPNVEGLRPTPDRVRETLFNWLGQDLTGLSCLDLFAGSGVLGFEAGSRGAAHVTLVEHDKRAFTALQANAKLLGSNILQVVRADALGFLASTTQGFDIIFLDPPYYQGWLDRVAPLLTPVLAKNGLIYAEAEYSINTLDNGCDWQCVRRGKTGQVFYHLLQG